MTKPYFFLYTCFLLILLVGCSKPYPRMSSTIDGKYQLTYKPLPDPIPINKLFVLGITVVPSQELNLTEDTKLTVDARMPSHAHGMNTVPQVRIGKSKGEFLVEGMLFHMSGLWEISIEVDQKGIKSEAIFKVIL